MSQNNKNLETCVFLELRAEVARNVSRFATSPEQLCPRLLTQGDILSPQKTKHWINFRNFTGRKARRGENGLLHASQSAICTLRTNDLHRLSGCLIRHNLLFSGQKRRGKSVKYT